MTEIIRDSSKNGIVSAQHWDELKRLSDAKTGIFDSWQEWCSNEILKKCSPPEDIRSMADAKEMRANIVQRNARVILARAAGRCRERAAELRAVAEPTLNLLAAECDACAGIFEEESLRLDVL